MVHRLVNVTQGKIGDLLAHPGQIFLRKTPSLPHKIIRPGVQQEHMRHRAIQSLQDLPDLRRGRRPEISRPHKPHPPVVHVGSAPRHRIPRLENRPVRVEFGPQQLQQTILRKIPHPGRFI